MTKMLAFLRDIQGSWNIPKMSQQKPFLLSTKFLAPAAASSDGIQIAVLLSSLYLCKIVVWPLLITTPYFIGLDTNTVFVFVKYHQFAWRANQWLLVRARLFSSVPSSNTQSRTLEGLLSWQHRAASFKGHKPRLTHWQRHCEVFGARHNGPLTNTVKNKWRKPWLCVWEKLTLHIDPWL